MVGEASYRWLSAISTRFFACATPKKSDMERLAVEPSLLKINARLLWALLTPLNAVPAVMQWVSVFCLMWQKSFPKRKRPASPIWI